MKHVFGKVSKRKLITKEEEKAIVLELRTQDLDIDENKNCRGRSQ